MFLDKNNNLEKGVIEQASQINLLTNNISTTNDSKLIELLEINNCGHGFTEYFTRRRDINGKAK